MEKNQPLVGKLVDPETLANENPPVDEFMKQQSELLDMIAGGLAGLSALSAQKNFNEEKINRIVEAEVKKQFDQKDYIDLNHMFNFGQAKQCYANPIEPSSEGSRVIAQFIKPRIEGNSII